MRGPSALRRAPGRPRLYLVERRFPIVLGDLLKDRLPPSLGTTYYVSGSTGSTTNGGTSRILRSSGTDGATSGTNTLTSAGAAWTLDDVGHGIMIDVGGTSNFRKITGFNSATSITFSGATIAVGSGRTWKVGGPWKDDQDFFDRALVGSTSPSVGDKCKVMEWYTTLSDALDASTTTVKINGSPSSLGLPTSGVLFALQAESKSEYASGHDGVTDGTNTLRTSRPVFGQNMVGKQVWIQDQTSDVIGVWQKRTIVSVDNSGFSLVFSGATMAVHSLTALRSWRVWNIEVMTCTSYSGSDPVTCTVTRGTHSSMANSHDHGVRIDIPYMGRRATSLSDTGARHVVNSQGSALAPYTLMNDDGHDVYFQPGADTTIDATRHETLVLRTPVQYWVVRRNPLGGSLVMERARNGTGNPPNIYFANCLDAEIDGLVVRFSQAGSGWFSDLTSQRCHKYNTWSRYNDLDLNFNHHGAYEEGDSCDIVQQIATDHAYGNGIQIKTGALNTIVAHGFAARNRGIPGGGITTTTHECAGFFCEDDNHITLLVGNVSIDNHRGFRGSAVGGGGGKRQRAIRNVANFNGWPSSGAADFTNSAAGNAALLAWDLEGVNFSSAGTGTNVNLSADPLVKNRFRDDLHPQLNSPLYLESLTSYVPELDFDGFPRIGATAGPFASAEERGEVVFVGGVPLSLPRTPQKEMPRATPRSLVERRWVGDAVHAGVQAVVADATGAVIVPTLSATSEVVSPVAVAIGDVVAPVVSAATDATVIAVVADATGDVANPTLSAGSNVTTPVADATGDVANPTSSASLIITSVPADATGDVANPTLSAGSVITSVVSDATGDVANPTVSSVAIIIAVIADATGDIANPVLLASSTVTIPTADCTGRVLAPTVMGGTPATPSPSLSYPTFVQGTSYSTSTTGTARGTDVSGTTVTTEITGTSRSSVVDGSTITSTITGTSRGTDTSGHSYATETVNG